MNDSPQLGKHRAREAKTLALMINIYCRNKHRADTTPCGECAELLRYSMRRLSNCTFRERKPACSKCSVHCYAANQRNRIRAVMRYAGPRMIFLHPILTINHLLR
ncbi:MAG: nitrous oxide-stimulated promoter family protein [Prevotellaceae bacterium]|jgi:hypothetical protein|nr:nitrous oxide-stimulated promoter family protein [Prevotellaceae bacterium]